MGHRTYLLIEAEGQVEQLFEANNMLPVFWLALLSQADLQAVEPQWYIRDRLEKEEQEEELESFLDQWPSPTNLVLTRDAVVTSSARFARVLQQHRPELVALHQEFTQYVLAWLPQETDQVQLDVVALTAFSSTKECLKSLCGELAALDRGLLPAFDTARSQVALTGFASEPISNTDYPVLSQLQAVVSQRPGAPGLAEPATPRRKVWYLLGASGAGALLLLASYCGFREDGLTAMVLLVLLLGVAVMTGSVVGLLGRRHRKL